MSLHSWLQYLRSALAPRRGQRRQRRRGWLRAATRRPNFEVLEDRLTPSLSSAGNYAVGANPQDVVTGDFNNDGKLDLVVANFESASVSVLLGAGDGTFTPTQTFATSAWPLSVAVGDFNKDGNLDLATAGDYLSVFLGNGDGTFRAPNNINILESRSAAVGDFNGDGNLDLGVVRDFNDYFDTLVGEATVLLGNGDGSFSAPIITPLGSGYHSSGAVADFNGDGNQDLAVTNADFGEVVVLLGDGRGNFSLRRWGGIGNSYSVDAGDVNGDAKVDVVTANYYGTVSVLLGDGMGGFATPRDYDAGSALGTVVLGDFNRDTHLDIAVADGGDSGVSILRGFGNGAFSTAEHVAAGPWPSAVAAGDFNGDDWLDAATANSTGRSVSVLINDQSWPFVPPTVSVGDATVTEGNTGTVYATFTLTLAYASNVDVTVHYVTADITATAGSDYQAASGMLLIPAGQTTGTITVLVNGDRLAESNETFSVNLSNPTNASIGDSQGGGTIVDNEPRISISDVTRSEGRKNQTTLFTFTVTLSAPYDQAVTMSFRTVDGTATTSDHDYVAQTGTLTFAPGETSKTITIVVNGDNKRESNEFFYLDLFGNSGNSLFAKSRGIGTILNDD